VATTSGKQAIETLHVGDAVLSEDATSGKVEPEQVQAVINDGVKPLVALSLSDGTTLRVTADHPFWVDGGPGITQTGWLPTALLRPGDRLRTDDGKGVTVLGIEWNVGEVTVYTLTVAHDHTFFVGNAQVLVHNSNVPFCPTKAVADAIAQVRDILGASADYEKGDCITCMAGVVHALLALDARLQPYLKILYVEGKSTELLKTPGGNIIYNAEEGKVVYPPGLEITEAVANKLPRVPNPITGLVDRPIILLPDVARLVKKPGWDFHVAVGFPSESGSIATEDLRVADAVLSPRAPGGVFANNRAWLESFTQVEGPNRAVVYPNVIPLSRIIP